MNASTEPYLVTGAWPERLSEFVSYTEHELLVVSPWITLGAARLIGEALRDRPEVGVRLLSRLDVEDFLTGASDFDAFRTTTYPENVHIDVRALKLLHAKMLISDRTRALVGSANLTNGGLFKNHEAIAVVGVRSFAEECARFFYALWEKATTINADLLSALENEINGSRVVIDDDEPDSSRAVAATPRARIRARQRLRYIAPTGSAKARRLLSDVIKNSLPVPDRTAETRDAALEWLRTTLKFMPHGQRQSDSVLGHLERLFYHKDVDVRATAIDHAGRLGAQRFVLRLQTILSTSAEAPEVRSAAAFALALLGAPSTLDALQTATSERGDVGRWAKRACFTIAGTLSLDEQKWLFELLGVADIDEAIDLVASACPHIGTVSERLTKGLIVECISTGRWTDNDFDLVVLLMFILQQRLIATSRFESFITFVRGAAEVVRVRPGDLRHGPFSPTLLRRVAHDGWRDAGLLKLVGQRWQTTIANFESVRTRFLAIPEVQSVVGIATAAP